MNDIITRARALLAAATPGPWKRSLLREEEGGWAAIGPVHEERADDDENESGFDHASADAALIAAAPELIAALCDEVERLRAVEAESAAMREALPSILDSHRKWLMASERAGETQAYIEQQGESPWPFRGNGPAATERRLADQLAKAEDLYSIFRSAVGGFGSRGPALLDRLAAAEAERDSLRAEVEKESAQAAALRGANDNIAASLRAARAEIPGEQNVPLISRIRAVVAERDKAVAEISALKLIMSNLAEGRIGYQTACSRINVVFGFNMPEIVDADGGGEGE